MADQGRIHYQLDAGVATLRLDDGKANALSSAMIDELHAALDRAEAEASAVLLVGRTGKFCAGFDLQAMLAGPESARALVGAGARLLIRIWTAPLPVVAACTGHALAAGAILLLACDARVGALGAYKIGLNEVALGMTPPVFLVEMARHRLSRRHLTRAVTQAEIYDAAGAADAGFLDQAAPEAEVEQLARAEAARLGQLPRAAFAAGKQRERGAIAAELLASLEADLDTFEVASPQKKA